MIETDFPDYLNEDAVMLVNSILENFDIIMYNQGFGVSLADFGIYY